jgi:hypothetical protein
MDGHPRDDGRAIDGSRSACGAAPGSSARRVLRGVLHGALLATALSAASGAPAAADIARRAVPPPAPKPPVVPADALFFDDFSDGLSRWSLDRDSVWTVRHGALLADLPDVRQSRSFAYAGDEAWGDVAVEFDVCQMRGVDKGVVVRVQGETGVGVDLRGPGYQDVVLYRRELPLGRARAGNGNGVWHHVRVECRGNRYRVLLDGEVVIERADRFGGKGNGRIALAAYTGGVGQCTAYYDNVLVTPLE